MLTSRFQVPCPAHGPADPHLNDRAGELQAAISAGKAERVERLLSAGVPLCFVREHTLNEAARRAPQVLTRVLDACLPDVGLLRAVLAMSTDAGLLQVGDRLALSPYRGLTDDAVRQGLTRALSSAVSTCNTGVIAWLEKQSTFQTWLVPMAEACQNLWAPREWLRLRAKTVPADRLAFEQTLINRACREENIPVLHELVRTSVDPSYSSPWSQVGKLAQFASLENVLALAMNRRDCNEHYTGWLALLATHQTYSFGQWLCDNPEMLFDLLTREGLSPECLLDYAGAYEMQNLIKAMIHAMTPAQVGACVRAPRDITALMKRWGRTDVLEWVPFINNPDASALAMDIAMGCQS